MRPLRRAVVVLAVCALSGCTTLVAPPAVPAPSEPAAQAAWHRVLQRFVDARGEVDFAALSADRGDLDSYVRHIADTPLPSVPDGSPRMAYMINAYNALSMFNVIDSGIPVTHAGFNKVGFFVLRKLRVGGEAMSLRSFENEVIRPYAHSRGDPRIHFALNCSALACPVLPREPFVASTLEAQLERETRAFFARPQNFRVDDAAATVWLSELLDFYREDFVPVPAASLLQYANRYAPRSAPPDYTVRFTPYDWTVANSRRPR